MKERICECLKRIREQNPASRILIFWTYQFSFTGEYTRKRAHKLGIDCVFLPIGLPDLNPIEQVWKSIKWEASPLIVKSGNEFRALVSDLFEQLTPQLSFAKSWINEFFDFRLQFFS